MGSKANPNDVISLREALNIGEIIVNQDLIDLLVSKGLITQEELVTKIEANHLVELRNGEKLSFGALNWILEDLKPFIRKNGDFWDYYSDQEN